MHAYLAGGRNPGKEPYTGQRPFSCPEAVYLARGRITGKSGDAKNGPGEFARQASLLEHRFLSRHTLHPDRDTDRHTLRRP